MKPVTSNVYYISTRMDYIKHFFNDNDWPATMQSLSFWDTDALSLM